MNSRLHTWAFSPLKARSVNKPIIVREFARLTTEQVSEPSLDRAHISRSAFDWLCRVSQRYRTSHEPALADVVDRRSLHLDNYVGVLQTPCGTRLEILPKTFDDNESSEQGRRLLQRLITSALDIPAREAGEASLQRFETPLSEWVMTQFLVSLEHVIKRGVRSDYRRVEGRERFLRGQLDMVQQMRQPPGRAHLFNIRHDLFLPDRAENRLLKLALERVATTTELQANWRLAQELRSLLNGIPISRNVADDFKLWHSDRLLAHYQVAKPWCELILYHLMPLALQGEWRGISMLFPMEKLFERSVEQALRHQVVPGVKVTAQARSRSLCSHDKKDIFQLRPDIVLRTYAASWVLDAKWKRVYAADRDRKYGLSESDFYQLFAYGHKYLGGKGEMALIYPAWSQFTVPLKPFDFGSDLRLWVLPFDLNGSQNGRLIHQQLTQLPLRIQNGG